MASVRKFLSWVTTRVLGELLFFEIFFCYAVPALGFFVGIPVGWYTLPMALLAAVAVSSIGRSPQDGVYPAFIVSLICWAVAVVLAVPLIDRSYDGISYHQEIVGALCSGWIPLDEGSWSGIPLRLWTLHYAKALEISEASVVAFTGLLESGKCVNWLFGVSVGCILYGFISSRFPEVGRRWRLAVVAVALCNPVFVCQSFTYYIDYAKYFFTLLSILCLVDVCGGRHARRALLLFCCVVVFAAGTKFNAFFEIGVVVFACMVWLAATGRIREAWRIAWVSALAAVVGAVVFGWHPYVTNTISAGHPLYPLMGEGSVDIMTYNTPPEYLPHDRFTNFFRSLLTLNVPTIDTREGGFGILMLPMLVLSFWSVWRLRHRSGWVPMYVCLWILVSCFFFEQSWWARYVAQLWIVPVVGVGVAVAYGGRDLGMRITAWFILVGALLTGIVSLAGSVGGALKHTLYRHAVEEALEGRSVRVSGLNEAVRRHMQEAGVTGIPVDTVNAGDWLVPYYGLVFDTEHYPVLLLDSVSYSKVRENVEAVPVFDYDVVFQNYGKVCAE